MLMTKKTTITYYIHYDQPLHIKLQICQHDQL